MHQVEGAVGVGGGLGVARCFLSHGSMSGEPVVDEGGGSFPTHSDSSGVLFAADGKVDVVDLVGGRGDKGRVESEVS